MAAHSAILNFQNTILSYHKTMIVPVTFWLTVYLNPNQTDVWMPCQDWGVASAATSIYLGTGTNFCSKIMFPQKLASILTYLAPFSEFFFLKITKKWRKLQIYQKIAKNE